MLGLGNLGPEAALPVMEGKAMLFKEFAGIDAWPICLNTQDPDEIVRTIQALAPGFGAINLEDISSPRCFEIERRLKTALDIPVMHDDQHGTAVVILAALTNALSPSPGNGWRRSAWSLMVSVPAGTACCRILLAAGLSHLVGCEPHGIVLRGDGQQLRACRTDLTSCMTQDRPQGTLQDALKGLADVFIGLSVGNIVTAEDLDLMAADRIVFAMANPDPEAPPELAASHCRIFATGRSDYPNQINNALAFPGIFRGALDVQARDINEAMKLAAAKALAETIPPAALSEDYIIPSVFDKEVVPLRGKKLWRQPHVNQAWHDAVPNSATISRHANHSTHMNPAVSTALLARAQAVLQCAPWERAWFTCRFHNANSSSSRTG